MELHPDTDTQHCPISVPHHPREIQHTFKAFQFAFTDSSMKSQKAQAIQKCHHVPLHPISPPRSTVSTGSRTSFLRPLKRDSTSAPRVPAPQLPRDAPRRAWKSESQARFVRLQPANGHPGRRTGRPAVVVWAETGGRGTDGFGRFRAVCRL